mmetsp:Transcript_64354/g.162008  ORF Transcript_64354/g.162008 Transcript_64354/m.162008 type:complete len:163 (-) Transcript_64354:39-527(-)
MALPQGRHPCAVTRTALGECRIDRAGHLLPLDAKHAPVKHYRSYGEWWEARQKAAEAVEYDHRKTSRFWPFGQDVTKVYQTLDKAHQFRLDDRCVEKARLYVPPRSGSLPDLRSHQHGGPSALGTTSGFRHAEPIDAGYHRAFQNSIRTPSAQSHHKALAPS